MIIRTKFYPNKLSIIKGSKDKHKKLTGYSERLRKREVYWCPTLKPLLKEEIMLMGYYKELNNWKTLPCVLRGMPVMFVEDFAARLTR